MESIAYVYSQDRIAMPIKNRSLPIVSALQCILKIDLFRSYLQMDSFENLQKQKAEDKL